MHQYSHHKYELQRHWKWLLPFLVISLGVIFVLSPIGNATQDFGSLYLNPSVYEGALAHVNQNKKAIELFGKPIEAKFLLEGEVNFSDNGEVVDMVIPIKGPKSKGRMDVEARKVGNIWEYQLIHVRIKNPPEKISILEPK